ncbi:MAG: SLC13 family permease [Aquificae bacterium]|nr:SLC13 family permease [Aquificota bacterium]
MTAIEKLIVVSVLLLVLFLLSTSRYPTAYAFALGVSLLTLAGILTPPEALSGFSNPQVATLGLLLVVAGVLHKTKAVDLLLSKVLKPDLSYKSFLSRLLLLTSVLSAFLNNTPVVASLIPYVHSWTKKKGVPLSKVLIPLSYAAILGGTVTLIGTSTNLIAAGLYEAQTGQSLHLLDFTPVGLAAASLGLLYLTFVAPKLLPSRSEPLQSLLTKTKEYLVETVVLPSSEIIGKSVREANLRNLKGLYLVEIIRRGKTIAPVSPEEVIRKGDVLVFAGNTAAALDLINNFKGLALPRSCRIPLEQTDIVEVLIPPGSDLIGKTIKEVNFRSRFDAAVIGIHRQGEKIKGKIGEQVLKPGDLLLVLTGKDFYKKVADSKDLYLISKVGNWFNFPLSKALLSLGTFAGGVAAAAAGFLNLFNAMLLVVLLFLIFRLTTPYEVRRSLDLNLLFTAALSLALGTAVVKVGLSEDLALFALGALSDVGPLGILAGLYALTALLTEIITNIGAVAIAFSVAVELSELTGFSLKGLTLLVAYAASASFLIPTGYQTNLLVHSLGGYKLQDFIKVGLPLSLIYGTVTVLGIYLLYA